MAVEGNSVTVIGGSVQVRGNLSGAEDLHVLGRVEGSLELESTLVVAQSGIVKAEVSVRNAIVSGVVVGNIHATESVEITEEGRMVGDIAAPRVIIVDGASFRGNVDMGDIENMPARPPRQQRPKPAPIPAKPAAAAPTRSSRAEPVAEEEEEEEIEETPPPPKKTTVVARPAPAREEPKPAPKRPSFLNPPKASGLPKAAKGKKKKVVVKRR